MSIPVWKLEPNESGYPLIMRVDTEANVAKALAEIAEQLYYMDEGELKISIAEMSEQQLQDLPEHTGW